MSIRPFRDIKRRKTKEINVGKVKVGGNNPISVQSMTNKMLALSANHGNDCGSATYLNTMSRYAAIKEEEAQVCKDELLVLWTDFFKPQHLEANPDLHDTFWHAAKLCSACKVEVSAEHAQELMDAIESIHMMFWAVKGREVPWIRAS